MVEAGLTEKPVPDPKYEFYFPSPGVQPTCVRGNSGPVFSNVQETLGKALGWGCPNRP